MIDAYLNGLDRLVANGGDLSSVASVASFFVSRVDTEVDRRLPEDSPLRGKVALADAGVDCDDLTVTLEREGVDAFARSYADGLATLDKRAKEVLRA